MTSQSELDDLAMNIKAEAKRLGFLLVGISRVSSPIHFENYRSWIDHGYHGDMQYLSADYALKFRESPQEYFPGGKTIISVGYSYPNPINSTAPIGPENGRIAAYATIRDYHHTIPDLLKKLVVWIKQNTTQEFRWKIAADTSPVLEKELAQQAGLGWIGKNGCLINTEAGSIFLLGELFLTLDLPPDRPFVADHCGTCTRCIEACPTKCILSDRTINSVACISYQTIENKNDIPAAVRDQMENWIFGCDVCQIVCPWNIKAAKMAPEIKKPDLDFNLPLLESLQIDPVRFEMEFAQFPVKRATHPVFLRNILAALGYSKDLVDEKILDSLLDHPEPMVRRFAASKIWQYKYLHAEQKLIWLMENDPSESLREEIKYLLQGSQDGNPAF